MSSFGELSLLDRVYVGVCPDFVSSWASGYLVALNYFPVLLWFGLFVISLVSSDFAFALLSLWLTFDWCLNYMLVYSIKQPPPFSSCGGAFEMPSFASEQCVLFVCSLILIATLFRYRIPVARMAGLFLFVGVVLYARLYIGLSTPQQLVAGAGIGILSAVAFISILRFVVYPDLDWFLAHPIVRFIGWRRGILVMAHYNDFNEDVIFNTSTDTLPLSNEQESTIK